MSTRRHTLLQRLADGRFHSGAELGQLLGITRTAVWKHLRELEASGLVIHAVRGRGYRLAAPLELLSVQRLKEALPARARAAIRHLEVLDEVDSTNSYLLAQDSSGLHVCLAERQTAGRGRRGRRWVSPPGSNLYLSMMWQDELAPTLLPLLPLAVAVAILRVLAPWRIPGLAVKWPNDIVVGDAKLAGVLVEVSGESGGVSRVVAGVGLNLCMPPAALAAVDQPCAELERLLHRPVGRHALAAALISAILAVMEECRDDAATVLETWRDHDCLYGRRVEVLQSAGTFNGVACGIDDTGALLVRRAGRIDRVYSGDVSLRVQRARRQPSEALP